MSLQADNDNRSRELFRVPICCCGHSIYSHGEGPGECEGCANDGEAFYCRQYSTAYYEETQDHP